MSGYQELDVWNKSIELAEMVYRLSAQFPPVERFGMTSQLRRSATSVAANIAEGAARHGTRDFLRFLGIASGSLAETETFLVLPLRLGMAKKGQINHVLTRTEEVGRMLTELKRSLRAAL